MPARLPAQARERIPDRAAEALAGTAGIETFATVDFVGRDTGPYANPGAIGPIVEVDENSWLEANTWHFEEVSETANQVVLFDASRNVTLIIDYTTNEISVIDATNGEIVYIYDVTDVDYSMTPMDTFATVDFVGRDTGPYANPNAIGPIVEVDEDSWLEANTWHFEEVSETTDRVVLFDDSRDVTLIIDYTTNEISVINSANELVYVYDVTGVEYSMTPVIPDAWTVPG